MIVKPENMNFSDKTFSMIIYGSPGVGKTTLALSAPDPILLDFDRGVSRVRAEHRKDTSVCSSYKEVLADLESPEMKNYKTIIIDTGGSLVSLLKDWAMNEKGAKTKSGEFNSLKGFGFVKAEWASFTEYIKTVLGKNVIYIFHANEEKDKDGNPIQRLVCEGSVRNTVWTPCDFGGFLQMIGDQRVICFTPEQEYFAKGCHGVSGRIPVPALAPGMKNTFITELFEFAKGNIAAEAEGYNAAKNQYADAMAKADEILSGVIDAESANAAMTEIKGIEHALTSEREISAMWKAKVKELGLVFDRKAKAYTTKPTEPEE
jgi:hypothetical protein